MIRNKEENMFGRKRLIFVGVVFLLVIISGVYANDIFVDPQTNSVVQGNNIIVRINGTTSTSDVYAIQFDIVYDDTYLNLNSVSEGDFLNSGATTVFETGTQSFGRISDIYVARNSTTGIIGDGAFVFLNFLGSVVGSSGIGIENVIWVNSTVGNDSANTVVPTVTGGSVDVTGVPCDLTSASWSETSVMNGTQVTMTVAGTNCVGQQIDFEVWEDDATIFLPDDYITTITNIFDTASWTAVWTYTADMYGPGMPVADDDDLGNDGRDYYFIASVVGNPGESVNSKDFGSFLEVNQTPCGNGVIDVGEECDTPDLGLEDCVSQGYESGTLACYPQGHASECSFDYSSCVAPTPGVLQPQLIYPLVEIEVSQNEFFLFNSSVSCSVGDCGTVTATLDPTFTEEWGEHTGSNHPGTIEDTFMNLNDIENYALDPLLRTYVWPINQVANAIVIKWDLSAIPVGSTINSAELQLYQLGGTGVLYDMPIYRIINVDPVINLLTGQYYDGVNSWTPNSCCYNSYPMAQADISIAEGSVTTDLTNGYKIWSVTNMVQDWVSGTQPNYGMLINPDVAGASDDERYFASSEDADSTIRPKLIITYTTGNKAGAVSMNIGATPFYTTENNPADCGIMTDGQTCITTWYVNATGAEDTYEFFVTYSSDDVLVNDQETSRVDINITSLAILCVDSDGDGYNTTTSAECGVVGDIDCNDAVGTINPGAIEICDNIDNDCDALTLDGSGESAPLNFIQYGVCSGSLQNCSGGGWVDEYLSIPNFEFSEATCDDGLDNDCDILVDLDDSDCPECILASDCDDGVACTVEVCNAGVCEYTPNDGNCDNGLWCDGAETCDSLLDCQVGTPPVCSDVYSCTDDLCNEGTDSCDNLENDLNCGGSEVCNILYFPAPTGCGEITSCTGQPDGTACDDGTYCNGLDECQGEVCTNIGPSINFDDGIGCTDDSCDEINDVVVNTLNDGNCDNGLWCDGAETCDSLLDCQAGTSIDCTGNNLPEIGICTNSPDNNPLTFDFALEFISTCDDFNDECRTGTQSFTHTCDLLCGAECEQDSDCIYTECDNLDGCVGPDYYDYSDIPNSCSGEPSCECTSNSCGVPVVTVDDPLCTGLCVVDTDCDGLDQDYCSGNLMHDEGVCNAGICEIQTTIVENCDDTISCTTDSCNGGTLSCEHLADNTVCDDGAYCNGVETCNILTGCVSGVPVSCSDGVDCTDDSCNEGTDSCDNIVNDGNCDNGDWCDGSETCDAGLGCLLGTPQIINDGVGCTVDSCDETNDVVVNSPDDSFCQNGDWCDGTETCDPFADCQIGTPPTCDDTISCTADSCDEQTPGDNLGQCVFDTSSCGCSAEGPAPIECNDGNPCTDDICTATLICDNVNNDLNSCGDSAYCTVNEQCSSGVCVSDPLDCSDAVSCTIDSCNDVIDSCVHSPDDAVCNDGFACTGLETCDESLGCQATPVDCSGNNLLAISTCTNSPDDNPLTLDIASGFSSVCQEPFGQCTIGSYSFAHTCDQSTCGGCESDVDCDDSNPATTDVCQADCSCSHTLSNCVINDLYWNSTNMEEGEYVELIINGTNCLGYQASITIWEYDGLPDEIIGGGDDAALSVPLDITINSNLERVVWQTEWQDDGLLGGGGDPEYYFRAVINSQTYESGKVGELLQVGIRDRKYEEMSISLQSGKNSLSIPLILDDPSIASVFADVSANAAMIYTYDNGFKIHHFSGLPSNLDEIEPGKGYFIFMNNPDTLVVNGTRRTADLDRPTFNLVSGWNLIGTFSNQHEAEYVLGDVDYSELYTYNEGSGLYEALNNDSVLNREESYWIYMDTDSSFVPITGGIIGEF